MSNEKPIVYFDKLVYGPHPGASAIIKICSVHPKLGSCTEYGRVVTTSQVQEVTDDGFKTLNTHYVFLKKEEQV